MLSRKAACLVLTLGCLTTSPIVSIAHAKSYQTKTPQYLTLRNNGAYTLESVTVKWKDGSETLQQKFQANVDSLEAFCVDLSQIKKDGYGIREGSEVWLVANIMGGEKESCRKDTKRTYKKSGKIFSQKMSGTTYNNNRCKNNEQLPLDNEIKSGNSKGCGDGVE